MFQCNAVLLEGIEMKYVSLLWIYNALLMDVNEYVATNSECSLKGQIVFSYFPYSSYGYENTLTASFLLLSP